MHVRDSSRWSYKHKKQQGTKKEVQERLRLRPSVRPSRSHLVVFVVLEHADAVLDDEEQVDAGQGGQALPHAVEGRGQVAAVARRALAVVVVALRLQEEQEEEEEEEFSAQSY